MKPPTYRDTLGLELYPEHERFAVWRAAHQHLMRKDYSYARQHQVYRDRVTRTATLVPLAFLPLALGGAAEVAAPFLHWPATYGVVGIVAGIVFSLAGAAYICRLAFRHQKILNHRVAGLLQERATAWNPDR